MNADAAQRYASRATALREVGLDACRRSALGSLRARTVVKESHATPVTAMAFNTVEPAASNLFASVGGDQATIYDDCHFGDFIGIVAQYTHAEAGGGAPGAPPPPPPKPDAPQALTAIGWVAAPPAPAPHPHGDAWLAVGGADGALSLISATEARVAFRMGGGEGGAGRVLAVAGAGQARPGLAATLHAGGTLALWAVAAEARLASWSVPGGTTVVADPGARLLAVGGEDGAVRLVALPAGRSEVEGVGVYGGGEAEGARPPPVALPAALPPDTPTLARPDAYAAAVEALAFLGRDGTRLLVKHADGRCVVWGGLSSPTPSVLASWRVPGHGPAPASTSSPGPSASALSVTADGALLAVGSPGGEAFVFDLSPYLTARAQPAAAAAAPPPAILARAKPPRIAGPIRAVALSDDGRHLSVAVGGGFVFRFEAGLFGPSEEVAAVEKMGGVEDEEME